jgi:hypothetical protein
LEAYPAAQVEHPWKALEALVASPEELPEHPFLAVQVALAA